MTSIDKQASRAASAITPSLESNHLESSGKSPPRHNRDVHKKVPMVVVIDAGAAERKPERRRFGTVASELRRLCAWLQEQGVEEAVMESTAQYWRPVWSLSGMTHTSQRGITVLHPLVWNRREKPLQT